MSRIKNTDSKVKSLGTAGGGALGNLAVRLIKKGVMTRSEAIKIIKDLQIKKP
jgi:hypothetical protein|tara:strand:+ start:656 stop:814 length:159 start_codon:yes stop_codon:yes gene_type:complete